MWRALSFAIVALVGCDTGAFAAQSTVGVMVRGAPALGALEDEELARRIEVSRIGQLEALLGVIGADPAGLVELARARTQHARRWLETEALEADARGEVEEAFALQERAFQSHVRAREVGLTALTLVAPEARRALRDPATRRAWLASRFVSRVYAPMLLWTGTAWASATVLDPFATGAREDLRAARDVLERAVELAPTAERAHGLVMLGVVDCALAERGSPRRAQQAFVRALELTERRSLDVQVRYAESYAVPARERDLFVHLVDEIANAPDALPSARIDNVLARRRARALAARVDALFPAGAP